MSKCLDNARRKRRASRRMVEYRKKQEVMCTPIPGTDSHVFHSPSIPAHVAIQRAYAMQYFRIDPKERDVPVFVDPFDKSGGYGMGLIAPKEQNP